MNSSQADNAIKALTGVKLGESGLLHAQRSKHSNALNWKGAQTGLERFMCTQDERPSPKCFMNSPPPTSTAVLSDVPEGMSPTPPFPPANTLSLSPPDLPTQLCWSRRLPCRS